METFYANLESFLDYYIQKGQVLLENLIQTDNVSRETTKEILYFLRSAYRILYLMEKKRTSGEGVKTNRRLESSSFHPKVSRFLVK